MNVKTIKLNGQTMPIHFGFAAIATIEELTGKSLDQISVDISQSISINTLMKVVYAGLKHGARLKDKEFTASVENVADWFDGKPYMLQNVIEIFTEQMVANTPKAKEGNPKATESH